MVIGFKDPDLTRLERDSPTFSLRSRLLFFSTVAARHWKLTKGDIKNAFLQGDSIEESRQIYGEPPPELRERLGLG